MVRRIIAALLLGGMLLTGCGWLNDSEKYGALPNPPVRFTQQDYVNPKNPEDGYMAVEYGGRLYLPYGTLKGVIRPKDVQACIGYVFQEDYPDDTNSRLHTLAADQDVNYLMEYYVNGMMEQPTFYRALDTRGREIVTPGFIESLDYDVWK